MRSHRLPIIYVAGVIFFTLAVSAGPLTPETTSQPSSPPVNAKRGVPSPSSPGPNWLTIKVDGLPPIWMEKNPWWRRKPKAAKRLQENHEVLVSVVSEKAGGKDPLQRLRMAGAGLVKAPPKFAYERVKEFYRLKQLSDFVVESKFDPKKSRLFLHVAAFNYHARSLLEIRFRVEKGQSQILFHIVAGTMKGLRGVLQLEDVERRRTEISMTAFYDYAKLPIPKFFVEFGFEVVLKRVAEKLRNHVEELWKKNQASIKPTKGQ